MGKDVSSLFDSRRNDSSLTVFHCSSSEEPELLEEHFPSSGTVYGLTIETRRQGNTAGSTIWY